VAIAPLGVGLYRIVNVLHGLQQLGFGEGRQIINSLIEKKVFEKSPDGTGIKFTDYGLGLFRATAGAQAKWESEPIAKVSPSNQDEVLIRAGDAYLANHLLREIFGGIRKEVAVIDPYVDVPLFDLLAPLGEQNLGIRIVTSDNILGVDATAKNAMLAYKTFRTSYPTAEMRTHAGVLHDRFILWDRKAGHHLGHSIKDLGKKDAQVNKIANVAEKLQLFADRWGQATPIP
jgi:hypothetical protein